ncbi:MAG: cache domain-containing protein [Syntrophobacteraceae bacterium]|jgi:signal transduction histidine kinase
MEGYAIFDLVLDRARQFVREAAALYSKDSAVALSEFSNPQGRFVEGEKYVFVLDSTGVMLAHGVNQDYVGQDFYARTDIDGKRFIQEIVDRANSQGFGWVEYKWLDPVTKTERPKTVYFEKTNGVIICSGVYGANPASSILENPFHEDVVPAPPADFSPLSAPAHDASMEMDAQEHETELVLDDAKRLVEKAITFYKANDKGIALAEFSNSKGGFTKGEQYVFVLDSNGVMLAHGINEKYVGKDFYRTMDSDGKLFIRDIVDAANAKGNGWVEYKWLDPVTKTEQPKTVYFEKTNGVIVCSGIYR